MKIDIYDNGGSIGVRIATQGESKKIPILGQKDINDTCELARRTRDVLRAFADTGSQFPQYLDQFIMEATKNCDVEEYLTDLSLFLRYGGSDTCGDCRFFREDGSCKKKLPNSQSCAEDCAEDSACCYGIRKEQEQ